ncbi:RNA polymerase sigma factor [uncultured Oscillibacter sp.]|uniref:RNA polymerase sigma factor n=1 Tax=uncultured Oscillibacter sp. TaxID=876091 RepID=UPI0025FB5E80|nr:sigma-70 family RNA polymerase sigma factor [uncultured Oscillibacter sp.]
MTDTAFEAAVERYGDMVFRLAFSYLKNRADAEDIMQETLLKLYEAEKPFDSPEHERYWVVRVAVNGCKQLLRSPWRRHGPLEEAEETAVFDTPAQSELFRQVMSLPSKYRAVVYLHYYEGYAVGEIAAALGANPSTVQTWLMRARGQLKLILQEAET